MGRLDGSLASCFRGSRYHAAPGRGDASVGADAHVGAGSTGGVFFQAGRVETVDLSVRYTRRTQTGNRLTYGPIGDLARA
jgi:hypothetical protein